MKRPPLSRRFVLQGAAGVGIGLPFLEAMLDSKAFAQAAAPKRYLLGFAGCSLGGYDGNINDTIVPTTVGANFDLKPGLTNLTPIRDHVSIVTGLRIPTTVNSVTPAGGRPNNFHGSSHAPQLTGMRGGNFTAPTSEQLAAGFLGQTTFPALVVRVQVKSYVGADAPGSGEPLSYRRNGTSLQAVSARYSPQQLFQTLFGNFTPNGITAEQAAQQAWLLQNRKSVLDGVKRRYERLAPKLGAADKRRVDDHLQEVRELEQRVNAIPPPSAGACQRPMDPGADPSVGSGQNTGSNGNITYSQNLGYSGEEQRARAMCDLVFMAIACDLTRSVLFQFTNTQSFLNVSQLTGQRSDLHELSHGGFGNLNENTTVSLGRGINWHMKHWAYLLGRMQDTREGNTSILDNTASAFCFEGGHGYDPADGRMISAHSTENMAVIVAGGAGGLQKRQHLRGNNAHPSQVLLTCLRAVGYSGTTFGELSGEIPGLRA